MRAGPQLAAGGDGGGEGGRGGRVARSAREHVPHAHRQQQRGVAATRGAARAATAAGGQGRISKSYLGSVLFACWNQLRTSASVTLRIPVSPMAAQAHRKPAAKICAAKAAEQLHSSVAALREFVDEHRLSQADHRGEQTVAMPGPVPGPASLTAAICQFSCQLARFEAPSAPQPPSRQLGMLVPNISHIDRNHDSLVSTTLRCSQYILLV